MLNKVREYIKNLEAHQGKKTFQRYDEFVIKIWISKNLEINNFLFCGKKSGFSKL